MHAQGAASDVEAITRHSSAVAVSLVLGLLGTANPILAAAGQNQLEHQVARAFCSGVFHDDPLTLWLPAGSCVLSLPRCSSHILSGYEASFVLRIRHSSLEFFVWKDLIRRQGDLSSDIEQTGQEGWKTPRQEGVA